MIVQLAGGQDSRLKALSAALSNLLITRIDSDSRNNTAFARCCGQQFSTRRYYVGAVTHHHVGDSSILHSIGGSTSVPKQVSQSVQSIQAHLTAECNALATAANNRVKTEKKTYIAIN